MGWLSLGLHQKYFRWPAVPNKTYFSFGIYFPVNAHLLALYRDTGSDEFNSPPWNQRPQVEAGEDVRFSKKKEQVAASFEGEIYVSERQVWVSPYIGL